MFKKLKEKFGKKFFVTIIVLMVLASFAAGYIIEKFNNRNIITEDSSFFDRNQKEIVEGFMKNIAEYDDTMELKSVSYKKGDIHLFIDSKVHEFDEIEYILTEDNIQVIYISNIEINEDDYKQLINGEEIYLKNA